MKGGCDSSLHMQKRITIKRMVSIVLCPLDTELSYLRIRNNRLKLQ